MTMEARAGLLLVGLLLLAACRPGAADDERTLERTPEPSRWVSPDGTPAPRHALPQHSGPLVARPLDIPSPGPSAGTSGVTTRGRVCLVVADATYEGIAAALGVYRQDLEADGYEVTAYELVSGTAESLRGLLEELYNEPASLVGAVFIGDVPYGIYELMQSFADETPHYEDFPCGLYFMDLDGVWEDVVEEGVVHADNGKYDRHAGEVGLEIWVCRIDAGRLPNLGGEADVLDNYFEKNHLYGVGGMPVERRALVYLDDDWAYLADDDRRSVGRVYSEEATEVVDEPEVTTKSDYLSRLATQGYELIHTRCHGSAHLQQYARAGGDGNVPEFTGSVSFRDMNTWHWASDCVEYALSQNVLQGYEDGLYHPEIVVTRDQMAVYVARGFGLLP